MGCVFNEWSSPVICSLGVCLVCVADKFYTCQQLMFTVCQTSLTHTHTHTHIHTHTHAHTHARTHTHTHTHTHTRTHTHTHTRTPQAGGRCTEGHRAREKVFQSCGGCACGEDSEGGVACTQVQLRTGTTHKCTVFPQINAASV